ncbi:hypothetical protein JYT97_00075 [Haliea sp. AH-315-K21]|uniref:XRE family transcriptional regulator n=1 Tax=SAR86 cluster bacterium TaxID=2030880 RepID=A0A2A5CF56_9GAMM|nr:hypothetical protein [Haliea sp. AH-315-K21]MBN4075861.1 hypothetical protein [Gammaproteobacteria bacterium AH-315-E17]PCJ42100.1 MAG: hypothetical protein COA71_05775 [SAR86 cluster bacterium]
MNNFDIYLDELKEFQGFTTEQEIAAFLGIQPQSVSRARKRGYLNDDQTMMLADAIGRDPVEVFVARECIKEKNEKYRDVWLSAFNRVEASSFLTAFQDDRAKQKLLTSGSRDYRK